jgi:hypothetical protein
MLKAFVEDHNTDKAEPTAKACEQFDFDSVERAFGEESKLDHDQRAQLALALAFIFKWALNVNLMKRDALKMIGKRTLAMAWVTDPSLFNHDSLRSIAKQLGCTAANLAPLTAEFARLTGIVNEFKDHDWRKENENETTDK